MASPACCFSRRFLPKTVKRKQDKCVPSWTPLFLLPSKKGWVTSVPPSCLPPPTMSGAYEVHKGEWSHTRDLSAVRKGHFTEPRLCYRSCARLGRKAYSMLHSWGHTEKSCQGVLGGSGSRYEPRDYSSTCLKSRESRLQHHTGGGGKGTPRPCYQEGEVFSHSCLQAPFLKAIYLK